MTKKINRSFILQEETLDISQQRLLAQQILAQRISHDMLSGLSPISGLCDLLDMNPKNYANPEKMAHYFSLIRTSVENITGQLDFLRKFYRSKR